MIIDYLDLNQHETKQTEVPRYRASASGYGRKIPTSTMVRLAGRWRRVYVCCFSNAGTRYIVKGEDWIVVR